MKPVLLVVLQCPWRRTSPSRGWNSRAWRRELWSSRVGVRLQEALPREIFKVVVCDANPTLTGSPDEIFPNDRVRLCRLIQRIRPDVILAGGSLVRKVVGEISPGVPVVTIKSPAYRLLSRRKAAEIKSQLVQLAIELLSRR